MKARKMIEKLEEVEYPRVARAPIFRKSLSFKISKNMNDIVSTLKDALKTAQENLKISENMSMTSPSIVQEVETSSGQIYRLSVELSQKLEDLRDSIPVNIS